MRDSREVLRSLMNGCRLNPTEATALAYVLDRAESFIERDLEIAQSGSCVMAHRHLSGWQCIVCGEDVQ